MITTTNKYEQLSKERKRKQVEGTVPEWYTTPSWQMFSSSYSHESEMDVLDRHMTIAKTWSQYMPNPDYWCRRFFDLLWSGKYSPASPALANTGLPRGQDVSCSGQYIGDNVNDWYESMRVSAALFKNSFGGSGVFDIRERGSSISNGGIASGSFPIVQQFFQTAALIKQGNRRGAFAAYIDISNNDWYEHNNILRKDQADRHYGWIYTDSFIDALKAGCPEANFRLSESIYTKCLTGKGYYFGKDKANRHRPQMYKDLGLDVKASNLCCMTADQRVVTDKGILTVKELYDLGTPNLVVGLDSISKASQMLLPRPNAPIVQIETAEGYRHKVTPDHRVWKKDYGWIEAQHLVEGDKILTQQIEGLFGNKHNPDLALIMGLVAGDGTYTDQSVCIDLWKDKTLQFSTEIEHKVASLIQDQEVNTTSTLTPTFSVYGDKARLSSAPLARVLANEGFTKETKTQVPDLVWKGTKETVECYLRGLYVTDGHIQSSNEVCSLVLSSVDKALLQDIQILWSNLGVKTSINKMREGGLKDFGKGGIYNTQPCYRLLITSIQGCQIAEKALKLGKFRTGTVADNYNERLTKQGYAQKLYATFTGLTELPNEDAYCLTVDSETHAWTVNGLVTHNTEIMLHSSREYDFSCILGSMNLIHLDSFMEPDDDSIFVATIMLDCAVSAFLDKSKGVPGLEKVRAFTEKGRAVGLGILGLSTYLQMKNIPYESIEAQFIDLAFAKKLHDETLRASQFLAKIHGEPEWCKGYGVRNTHRTAIAPTKSTSILMGCVSESWLPDPLMIFDADSAVGEIRRIPPAFLAKMKERGVFNDKTISELIKNNGSAQKCGFLTPHEKLVFKNAYEIDNHLYIRRAGLRQKYICQGQALNCFIPENASEDYVSSLVTHALLNPNVLSLYYFYFKNGLIISDECVNCHA